MKRVVFFILNLVFVVFAVAASAVTPDQHALQVLQKDVPQSLRWFERMSASQKLSQVEIYQLFQSTLPEAQGNLQKGISVKGSVERMILLLEGARYFEQVQNASLEFQNRKEIILRVLQTAKDEMDRFQFGEDPQMLIEEWQSLGITDFESFTTDLVETYVELQKLLVEPKPEPLSTPLANLQPEGVTEKASEIDSMAVAELLPTPEATPVNPTELEFEKQRFSSYLESAEVGKIAEECQSALVWQTDQALSCESDESLECDRSYARQCKKLQ